MPVQPFPRLQDIFRWYMGRGKPMKKLEHGMSPSLPAQGEYEGLYGLLGPLLGGEGGPLQVPRLEGFLRVLQVFRSLVPPVFPPVHFFTPHKGPIVYFKRQKVHGPERPLPDAYRK